MLVGDARATTLAPPGTPTQPRHLRRQARLVDEDQPGRIEVELAVKPGLALSQDLRPLLLQCVRGFLYVKPHPRSQLFSALRPIRTSRSSARRTTISLSVMSLSVSIRVSLNQAHDEAFMPIKARPASPTGQSRLHPHRLWPAFIQRIAVDGATPNRAAAPRADRPACDAFETRTRSSPLNARPIQDLLV